MLCIKKTEKEYLYYCIDNKYYKIKLIIKLLK